MQVRSEGLPREVHDGLCQALTSIALIGDPQQSLAVITTAPSHWLTLAASEKLRMVDISRITGPTIWQSHRDVLSKVIEAARNAGWAPEQIDLDFSGHGDSFGPRQPGHIRPDIVLKDNDDLPIAVIEVNRRVRNLGRTTRETRDLASAIGAPFTVVINGTNFVVSGQQMLLEGLLDEFPSPHQLNLPLFSSDATISKSADSIDQSILEPESPEALGQLINSIGMTNLVVDYTIPWDLRDPAVIAGLMQLSSGALGRENIPDLLSGILSLLASNEQLSGLTALVPRSFMENSAQSSVRRHLITQLRLLGVVELPSATFLPMTGIPTSLISFGSGTHVDDQMVAFTTLSGRGDIVEPAQQRWFHDFIEGLNGRVMTLGYRVRLFQDRPWTAVAQHPESRQIEERLQHAVGTEPLSELCDIVLGLRHSREENTRAGVPVVRGRDLSTENLSRENLSKFKLETTSDHRRKILTGDILLQRIGAKPHVAVANSDLEGVVAGDTIFILRLRDTRVSATVIAEFLRSSIGQQLLLSRAQKTTAPTLSITGLRTVPIPTPKDDISDDLNAVRQIEEDLRTRADALSALRFSLFAVEDGNQFRTRVADLRRSARSIAVGLEQFESLDYRVRTLYPYPISYPYRTLSSITGPSELYTEQLRVVEDFLAFIASVSLALLEPGDRHAIRPSLTSAFRGGISMGSWRDLARAIGNVLSGYRDSTLAQSLSALWTRRRSRFAARVEQLIVARNAYHHGRGPGLEEGYREATQSTAEILQELVEHLAFLIDYPIRLVRDIDPVRYTGTVILNTLRLTGDHPGLPQEQLEYIEALPRNDLYMEVRPGYLHSLHPFLVSRNCQRCLSREVYFIERWDGSGHAAELKSFERGHTERSDEMGNELSRW